MNYSMPFGIDGNLIEQKGRTHFRILEVVETFDDDVWTSYTIQSGLLKGRTFKIPGGKK